VIGLCDSINPSFGRPFDAEVLGTVLSFPFLGERIGVPARAGEERLNLAAPLGTRGVPVVALVGSCMNAARPRPPARWCRSSRTSGSWSTASRRPRLVRRDVLAMEDAGARRSAIFTDYGVVTTTAANAPALARTLISRLAEGNPWRPT